MSPFDGLQLPKQIIHQGYIRDLNEDYIKASLINLRVGLIKGTVNFNRLATFGKDSEDIPEKITAALAGGRWLLSPDRTSLYYAYQLANGNLQAIMQTPSKKLTFDLFDLNNPESEGAKKQRFEAEIEAIMEIGVE